MHGLRLVLLALVTLSCGSGCAGPLGPGRQALERGELPRAARSLRALEPEFSELSAGDRSRYALYRGLAELALGELRVARPWLERARRSPPEHLSDAERGRLVAAWRSMGLLPGESATPR
jgi:hypothetical protein